MVFREHEYAVAFETGFFTLEFWPDGYSSVELFVGILFKNLVLF